MTTEADWQAQVGQNWSEMYRQTDRSFSGLTERLLQRIEQQPGANILDIGCGAGELSLAIARARPGAAITGVDISADLIAAAQARGEHSRARFVQADAAIWTPGDDQPLPDLLVSRHGVMFFAKPDLAFAHIHAVSAPGASLVFSCFRTMEENAWAHELGAILPDPPTRPAAAPLYTPGPFAFGDADFVRAILARAGWSAITHEPVDFAYIAGHGEDPIADAESFFSRIGPFAQSLRQAGEVDRESLKKRLRLMLKSHTNGDIVVFPAAAWIVSARRG